MAGKGKAVLVRQGAYWHLAHRVRHERQGEAGAGFEQAIGEYKTPETIQLSVENFVSIMEARRKLGDSFAVEIGPKQFMPVQAAEQMNRIDHGHGPNGSKHLKVLAKLGLIEGNVTTKKTANPPRLTERGREVLALAR